MRADISDSASSVRAAEAGLGSWVLGGQCQKPCPDGGDHKDEVPDGEEMGILFKGIDQWNPRGI